MTDQASTLRLLSALRVPALSEEQIKRMNQQNTSAYAIAVTGGKGGVGKSNVAVNLALALAALGRRITLLDADLALANADVLCGLNLRCHLGHVLAGERALEEVIVEIAPNVRLIPGGSGLDELADLGRAQVARLLAELRAMEARSEYMVVDTPAGIASNVTGLLCAANEVVIVTTPEPTAVVDAYATLKVLHKHAPDKPAWIVVNDTVGVGDAERIYRQLRAASDQFLRHRVELLGGVPHDPELVEAVCAQTPVVDYAPESPSSRAFRLIAKRLDQRRAAHLFDREPDFWQSFIERAGG